MSEVETDKLKMRLTSSQKVHDKDMPKNELLHATDVNQFFLLLARGTCQLMSQL